MMKKKLVRVLTTAAFMAAMLSACGKAEAPASTPESAPAEPSKEAAAEAPAESQAPAESEAAGTAEIGKIYLVSKGFQHQFWQAVLQGAETAAEEYGVEIDFQGPNTESDFAQQVQMLNNAINNNPPAIGLAALDTQSCMDSIKTAQSKGIPIV